MIGANPGSARSSAVSLEKPVKTTSQAGVIPCLAWDRSVPLPDLSECQRDVPAEIPRIQMAQFQPGITATPVGNQAVSKVAQAAQAFLSQPQNAGRQQGLEYGAARHFIDGIGALRKNDFNTAVDQLTLSTRMHQDPDTGYFLAKAQMGKRDWVAAIESLNSVVGNRARVFTDSVASLIPLAEFDLSTCYRNEGKESEARLHLASAQQMWEKADPELKTQLSAW